mmetsp:Transcript_97814/g.119826  ORF Transcript_97814/g.119826 Transcript_97814/m.119826 type:complete len:212 (+) Transcript_97814:1086-1721(+)
MEHHQFLLLANVPVVSFRSLFLELFVLLEELVVWEGNAIKPLQRVQVLIAQPISGGVLRHHEGLGAVGVGQMGPSAQIYEVTTTITARQGAIWDLVRDQLNLEGVLLEELQGLLFRQNTSLKKLRLLTDLHGMGLDGFEVVLFQLPLTKEAIIVKARLQGRADGQMATELAFHGLTHDVSRGMPKHVLALGMVELQQFHPAAAFQWPRHVP